MKKINDSYIFSVNQMTFENLYSKRLAFLEYPADWIIRFYNLYLKNVLPIGRILDYGCGSGNNSVFFITKGYEVYGVEITEAVTPLIATLLKSKRINKNLLNKFSIIHPEDAKLPFKDNFFDFVLSNQVLYYLPSKEQIQNVCKELSRCLRPGGIVFFSMMGPQNVCIKTYSKQIYKKKIHKVVWGNPKHRLYGFQEFMYVVKNREELEDLFSEFERVDIGYFDQSMFDASTFHWVFIGRKNK